MQATCDVGEDVIGLPLLAALGASSESDHEIHKFMKQVKYHGYVVVRNEDPEFVNLLEDMYRLSKIFFAQRAEFKRMFRTPVTDNGYTLREGVKESLMVRLAGGSVFPFDLDGIEDEEERALANELKERVMQYYAKMFEISKVCLAAIAHSLGIPPSKLLSLLEPDSIPDGQYSTVTVRLFHYFNIEGAEEPCSDHNDLGYITLIPCSAVPGLQMAKLCSQCSEFWVDVETRGSRERHDVVVFVGETMTSLLNGYIIAALHRVVAHPAHIERYSLPFLVKAWPSAVIDSNSLGCGGIIGKSYDLPRPVGEFMAYEQSRRQSVNNLY